MLTFIVQFKEEGEVILSIESKLKDRQRNIDL